MNFRAQAKFDRPDLQKRPREDKRDAVPLIVCCAVEADCPGIMLVDGGKKDTWSASVTCPLVFLTHENIDEVRIHIVRIRFISASHNRHEGSSAPPLLLPSRANRNPSGYDEDWAFAPVSPRGGAAWLAEALLPAPTLWVFLSPRLRPQPSAC